MASRTTICSIAEVLNALGKAASTGPEDADYGLISMLLPMVDDTINDFLSYQVVYKQYTNLLPDIDMFDMTQFGSAWPYGEPFDVTSNNQQIAYAFPGTPQILQVPNIPLRSVTTMYADYSAAGGQESGDFSSATLLQLGTDYYLDFDSPDPGQTIPYQSGVSWTGHIRRWLGGVWPARQRSCKITYYAGIRPDELDGVVDFPSRRVRQIKYAAMFAMVAACREMKAWSDRSGGQEAGPIVSERLADYSVSYAENAMLYATGLMTNLPEKCKELLRPNARIKR